jgi:sugar/nucleoside kinase (ribokinase family)
VAVKLGAEGALAARDNQLVHVPTIPVQVVDTVGAGDSFDAGFILGYLENWSLERSLKLATLCGAISTQSAGGTNGQATFDQAMQYVS